MTSRSFFLLIIQSILLSRLFSEVAAVGNRDYLSTTLDQVVLFAYLWLGYWLEFVAIHSSTPSSVTKRWTLLRLWLEVDSNSTELHPPETALPYVFDSLPWKLPNHNLEGALSIGFCWLTTSSTPTNLLKVHYLISSHLEPVQLTPFSVQQRSTETISTNYVLVRSYHWDIVSMDR